MLITVKLSQVLAFQFSDPMLSRDRAANFNGAANELTIDGPGLLSFIIIARKDVHVHMIVADVAKDGIAQVAISQALLVKAKHSRERIVRNRHVGRNLSLVVPP